MVECHPSKLEVVDMKRRLMNKIRAHLDEQTAKFINEEIKIEILDREKEKAVSSQEWEQAAQYRDQAAALRRSRKDRNIFCKEEREESIWEDA